MDEGTDAGIFFFYRQEEKPVFGLTWDKILTKTIQCIHSHKIKTKPIPSFLDSLVRWFVR